MAGSQGEKVHCPLCQPLMLCKHRNDPRKHRVPFPVLLGISFSTGSPLVEGSGLSSFAGSSFKPFATPPRPWWDLLERVELLIGPPEELERKGEDLDLVMVDPELVGARAGDVDGVTSLRTFGGLPRLRFGGCETI